MHSLNCYKIYISCSSVEGESEGYTVKTKGEDIAICDYPLLQTEFLYSSKKGTADIDIIAFVFFPW